MIYILKYIIMSSKGGYMKKSTIDRQIEFSKKYPDVIPIPLYSDALAKAILIRNPDILAMFLKAVLKKNFQ